MSSPYLVSITLIFTFALESTRNDLSLKRLSIAMGEELYDALAQYANRRGTQQMRRIELDEVVNHLLAIQLRVLGFYTQRDEPERILPKQLRSR
jgi:hypothetical protein